MKNIKFASLILMLLAVVVMAGCGGGDGDTIIPPDLPDNTPKPGDDEEPDITPITGNQFVVPGGFTDVRGVAVSQDHVYVADINVTHAFDKLGNLLNSEPSPQGATIQGIATFPLAPDVEIDDNSPFNLAGFPLIVHEPVDQWGIITIYGPTLDSGVSIEDGGKPDGDKRVSLPLGTEPIIPPATMAPLIITTVYDVTVDRFGSIYATGDIDIGGTPPAPDFPHCLMSFNRFQNYRMEVGGTDLDGDADDDETVEIDIPCFDEAFGDGVPQTGHVAMDSYFPLNSPTLNYTMYASAFNQLRDYVGVNEIQLNTNDIQPFYEVGGIVDNGFGFGRVIGEPGNSNPGAFAPNPPLNPDGGLEDPDLTAGGPSGMFVDPLTNTLYVCDPGNRRIQLFDGDTGAFIRQYGSGARGISGNNFVAPSSVAVDFERTLYIGDVNTFRVLREKLPGREFGNVAGTVRRLDNGNVLEGATVSIGSELGLLGADTTNINGQYFINNLLIGTYNMQATKFNYDSDSAVIQIQSDKTVEVNFNLDPRTPSLVGSYTGTVIDGLSNLPIDDVVVTIGGTSLTASTDDSGNFAIANIQPGTYQVTFVVDEYETLTRQIQITEGSVTRDPAIEMTKI